MITIEIDGPVVIPTLVSAFLSGCGGGALAKTICWGAFDGFQKHMRPTFSFQTKEGQKALAVGAGAAILLEGALASVETSKLNTLMTNLNLGWMIVYSTHLFTKECNQNIFNHKWSIPLIVSGMAFLYTYGGGMVYDLIRLQKGELTALPQFEQSVLIYFAIAYSFAYAIEHFKPEFSKYSVIIIACQMHYMDKYDIAGMSAGGFW